MTTVLNKTAASGWGSRSFGEQRAGFSFLSDGILRCEPRNNTHESKRYEFTRSNGVRVREGGGDKKQHRKTLSHACTYMGAFACVCVGVD